MKKKILLSIVLILAIFAVSPKSFANITESSNTKNISVSNIEAGVKVSLYRLTNVNYNYTANQPMDTVYNWQGDVKSWVEENYFDYSNPEKFYEDVTTNSEDARAFYDNLASAIKSGEINTSVYKESKANGKATYPVTEENLTGSVNFSNVEMGTYLIIIENGYMVYMPSVINLVPEFDNDLSEWILKDKEVVIKATKPRIEKMVNNLQEDNYSTLNIIPYTIIADVPTYLENSLAKYYAISDKMDNGLTLDKASIKVYGRNGDSDQEIIDGFSIEYDTTKENGEKVNFIVTFDYSKINSYESIKIAYNAKLNQKLKLGSIGNKNIAFLDYSNNPYNDSSYQMQYYEGVIVYTYGIEVSKVDKKDNTKFLSGAEFTLSQNENELYFVKTSDGTYYLANENDSKATKNLIVNNGGKLNLYGLDEGEYLLTETEAPNGYNISSSPCNITIADNNKDGKLDDEEGDSGIYSLLSTSTKGFMLPVTGGNGIIMFTIIGSVICIVSLIIFIIACKKVRNEK